MFIDGLAPPIRLFLYLHFTKTSIMKNTFLILLISTLFLSCSNSIVLEKKHHFENNNWFRFDEIIYELEVEAGQKYTFEGFITTDSTYNNRKIDLGFYIYLPDGGTRLGDKSFRILDYEYQHLGEKTNKNYQLPVVFKEELSINQSGKLKIKIVNHSQYVDNNGIISLELLAKKL